MNSKSIAAVLALCVVVVLGVWRFYDARARALNEVPLEERVLVCGTNVGYPPFIMTDENGSITGFDHDVAQAIAERLGRPLVMKDMGFDALIMALQSGSVDMIIGGISLTPVRMQSGLFMPYYGEKVSHLGVLSRRGGAPHAIASVWNPAEPIVVTTQAGTIFEELLEEVPGVTIRSLSDLSDIYLDVVHGRCDYALLDTDTVHELAHIDSDALQAGVVALPEGKAINGFGLAIAPQQQELHEQVAGVIADLHAEGVIDRLAARWHQKGAA
jgi:ABC-type amino acid transport substrate-binding protein